ncbi:MAG: HD-GYP domain-containing protein [Thermoanaerobacteraceae bacterium]|nr:HD-GYP domain-containing protein [Thermoanaerobacteraceae bacterium]
MDRTINGLEPVAFWLLSVVGAKDTYTTHHSYYVAVLAKAIAEKIGLNQEQVEQIYLAGLLHDIGKIVIPDYILQKPGKLTKSEFAEVKKHPETGYLLLRSAGDLFKPILKYVRHHHERWDGLGYPAQLKGNEIPLGAAIVAVADAYDAMISSRPYRVAMAEAEVLAEIQKNSGTQFHPEVVEVFIRNYQEIKSNVSGDAKYAWVKRMLDCN